MPTPAAKTNPVPSPSVSITFGDREVSFRFTRGARFRLGLLPVVPTWEMFCEGGFKTASAVASYLWACQEAKPPVLRTPEDVFVALEESENLDQGTDAVLKLMGLDPEAVKKKQDPSPQPPTGSGQEFTSG